MELKRKAASSTATTQVPEQTRQLAYLDVAAKEGRKFLDEVQYSHAVSLCEQLATEADPRKPQGLDVRSVEDFFEIRDKGGVLGKINLRVYFTVVGTLIVVLGCQKKESEGKMPEYVKIRMRNRIRILAGELTKQKP